MSKLSDVLEAVQLAKEAVSEAENARDAFLEPILAVLGATGGGIDHASDYMDELSITRVGSSRGCSWSDDYSFPTSIFEADDPLVAAKIFVEKKKQDAALSKRAQKTAEMLRLQKELLLEDQ